MCLTIAHTKLPLIAEIGLTGITIVMYEIESDVTQYAQNKKFNLTVGFKVSRDVRQRMNVTEI